MPDTIVGLVGQNVKVTSAMHTLPTSGALTATGCPGMIPRIASTKNISTTLDFLHVSKGTERKSDAMKA